MLLHSPIIITPRLLAGVRIDGSFISIDHSDYYLDLELSNGKRIDYHGNDLTGGDCSLAGRLSSLLSLMSACGEAFGYATRNRLKLSDTECGELFPRKIAEWCYQNSDELSMLSAEMEENPDLIQEEN